MNDYRTCMDEFARAHAERMERYKQERERDRIRRRVREGIAAMKENDELFLRMLIKVTAEELK